MKLLKMKEKKKKRNSGNGVTRWNARRRSGQKEKVKVAEIIGEERVKV